MGRTLPTSASGPNLSPETLRRVDILFRPEDRERAKALLYEQCGNNLPFCEKAGKYEMERFRFAALKSSDGKLSQLESAVKLEQVDWRDLLMATGFASDVEAHRRWVPKLAGEASKIDVAALVTGIHDRVSAVLIPLGFEREDDEWRRGGEVPQVLRVLTGLTSRVETRFFLQIRIEAKPLGVILPLPRLPAGLGRLSAEQGYVFRAGESEEAFYGPVERDINGYVQPWFARFISLGEVQRGFEDGTFKPHAPVGDHILVF